MIAHHLASIEQIARYGDFALTDLPDTIAYLADRAWEAMEVVSDDLQTVLDTLGNPKENGS